MYSTCLFCHANLGANAVVEQFPVGRRLAFDSAKGRLWVVCRACERWNLTPIEERWEAIESCERMFGETRLRTSTDNIGLTRVREGLELVRIGRALRPEIAAWRYGDQFGRRRRRHLLVTAGAGLAVTGIVVFGPKTGLMAGTAVNLFIQSANLYYNVYRARAARVRLRLPDLPEPVGVSTTDLHAAQMETYGDEWRLRIQHGDALEGHKRWRMPVVSPMEANRGRRTAVLMGQDAIRVAGQLLPAINSAGGKKATVADAVKQVEEIPDAVALFERALRPVAVAGVRRPMLSADGSFHGHKRLETLPPHLRLAMEMMAHEDSERRAFEGELATLEAAWRDAEEIAAIADSLLVPAEVVARHRQLTEGD